MLEKVLRVILQFMVYLLILKERRMTKRTKIRRMMIRDITRAVVK